MISSANDNLNNNLHYYDDDDNNNVDKIHANTTRTTILNYKSFKLIHKIISFPANSMNVGAVNENTTEFRSSSSSNGNSSTDAIDCQYECNIILLPWRKILLVTVFSLLIIVIIIGNTLVILAVITTRRLRTVTNCFVMSLAVADWLVGLFVMPPNVMLYVYESWKVGWVLCDIWISLDILLCTASILSLCAISLDRYLAVTQPLHYKKRRTKRLALIMIFVVWLAAAAITCPPIFGWYEPGRRKSSDVDCRYNQNKGYVIYSAMGSFFIPMTVMLYVYARICCVLTSRHNSMAKTEASERNDDIELENTSELENSPRRKYSMTRNHFRTYSQKSFDRADSRQTLYELVEVSKSLSTLRSSTITCKYSTSTSSNPYKPATAPQTVHICQSQTTSISQQCLCSTKVRIHNSVTKRMPIRVSSSKRETKAAQTLSMVVGVFIACWLPFFTYYLLIPFLPKEKVSKDIVLLLTWLGWISCAINPFIYAFYNADFRIAFWRLTFRKFCKNQKNLFMMKT